MTTIETAEGLRLRGNDAYGTSDFEPALQLYQESVTLYPQAKTLSNIAAVLHKLCRYEEAREAAQQCTTLDPQWAKGWWRMGIADELLKNFTVAQVHYGKAVELDKKNSQFQKYYQDSRDRNKAIDDAQNGRQSDEGEPAQQGLMDMPSMKAYQRAKAVAEDMAQAMGTEAGIWNISTLYAQAKASEGIFPTSEQFLAKGMSMWISGLQCAICDLSSAFSADAMAYSNDLQRRVTQGLAVPVEELRQAQEVLGGYPTGNAMNDMISALSHLGGLGTFLEMAPGRICPQPPPLRQFVGFQLLAQLGCVQKWIDVLEHREFDFGRGMKLAPAVREAYITFWANLPNTQQPLDMNVKSGECTPQEIVDYIQAQVVAGRTWQAGGLRSYAALMYRGSILFGNICQSMQQFAKAYGTYKWARQFIRLLDQKFQVTEQASYDEHGNFFRPTLRVGMIMAELNLLQGLSTGGDNIDQGPYNVEMELKLCLEISKMAHTIDKIEPDEFDKAEYDVAYRRKPLARAHSLMAARLNSIFQTVSHNKFKAIVGRHGLMDNGQEECDPYAVISKHYGIAAEHELPDSEEGSILWWAHAANMAQSKPNIQKQPRTLGELRRAINTGLANEKARDIDLFGENFHRNGQYETIARLTAGHFASQPDSFVFPPVQLVGQPVGDDGSGTLQLEAEGTIICDDIAQFQRDEHKLLVEAKLRNLMWLLMDTSKLEKKFGRVEVTDPPSLATLTIRELHKAGATFARNETDGDVIIQKAMDESSKESGT